MAFKKVCTLDATMSIKGSFVLYFLDPDRVECSTMWATPVESSGGVLKPMEKVLLWL